MLVLVTVITMAIFYFAKEMKKRHVGYLLFFYALFVLYAIGAASHGAGGNDTLAKWAGDFIGFLNQPNGINETLRGIANWLTSGW